MTPIFSFNPFKQEIKSWAKSTRLTAPAEKEEQNSRQPWELSARRVAYLLEKVIAANSNVVQEHALPFDSIAPPTIPIYDYLLRFKNMELDITIPACTTSPRFTIGV